jgi:hypothetical protein
MKCFYDLRTCSLVLLAAVHSQFLIPYVFLLSWRQLGASLQSCGPVNILANSLSQFVQFILFVYRRVLSQYDVEAYAYIHIYLYK